jgi:hypothetical protein
MKNYIIFKDFKRKIYFVFRFFFNSVPLGLYEHSSNVFDPHFTSTLILLVSFFIHFL